MPSQTRHSEGRPYVVAHVAVALDGATTGFEPDAGRFYELAATWSEDVTPVGADTILAQKHALAAAPRPGPVEGGPLLAVVDEAGDASGTGCGRRCGTSDTGRGCSRCTPRPARLAAVARALPSW